MKQLEPSEPRLVYAVDIDGILCVEKDYGSYEQRNLHAKPIERNIDTCNQLFNQGHVIILHTARFEQDRAATVFWLTEHGVLYHAMVMNKLKADRYIDDKNDTF